MPKHKGCAKCGSLKDEILSSRTVGDQSLALCAECAAKEDAKTGR